MEPIVARHVEGFYDTGAYALTGPSTTKNGGEVSGWAVSDSASGFDDVLRVHEHAADGTVSRVLACRRCAGRMSRRWTT